MAKRLYRSVKNKMIAGLCGGLGEYFETDPTIVRLVAALLVLAGGLSVWVYLIAWIIIPRQPAEPAA